MDVLLTLGIGFLTVLLGFLINRFFGFNIETIISQIAAVNVVLYLVQMLIVSYTNPSGLTAWSNYATNQILSQLPEEIIGEIGGVLAMALISELKIFHK